MSHVRFLSRDDVIRALPMADAIEAMKSAYGQLSAGQADMPLRGRVSGKNDGMTLVMPAYLQGTGHLGVKIASVFPQNTAKNLPIIYAMVLALDAETGRALALMEGSSLTAIRTGAGAGAATDILARPDSSVVAIIGSGVQAKTQLEAVCTARNIERVYVYSPTRAKAERFMHEMIECPWSPDSIIVSDSSEEAIREADIVCTATTSTTPVFDGSQLRAGTHINGVGSYRLDMQELDEITLQKSLIVVDSYEAVMAEAGEIVTAMKNGVISEDAIHAEIGDIINGKKSGRENDEQITFFKSVGVAVQDAISAHVALQNAEREGIGTLLELSGEKI
jgi:ornithine cyclodeaminase